jgi:hypothetical protein
METLSINKSNAIKAFNEADDKGKTLLTNLFGKNVLSQKITDLVKSYEDACNIKGINPLTLSQFSFLPKEEQEAVFGFHQITTIIEVINEGWIPDWSKHDQYKYYPWFDMNNGSGLSFNDYDSANTCTCVGSRLCLSSSEKAKYVGEQFKDIYTKFFTK